MGFSVAGGFVSTIPKVDTAAHPPLGSALCYRQTIYITLTGKTLPSFSKYHDDFLFSRKCLFGLSRLIKMVTKFFIFKAVVYNKCFILLV